jgi:hypothetical protein
VPLCSGLSYQFYSSEVTCARLQPELPLGGHCVQTERNRTIAPYLLGAITVKPTGVYTPAGLNSQVATKGSEGKRSVRLVLKQHASNTMMILHMLLMCLGYIANFMQTANLYPPKPCLDISPTRTVAHGPQCSVLHIESTVPMCFHELLPATRKATVLKDLTNACCTTLLGTMKYRSVHPSRFTANWQQYRQYGRKDD